MKKLTFIFDNKEGGHTFADSSQWKFASKCILKMNDIQ